MPHEEEAIPFSATALLGERLLILAPHPDDEVIGCGGVVAQHLRDHRQVRIVVVTDGCAATGVPDRETYRNLREDETRRGVALLGESATIDFLRFPDRGLDGAVTSQLRQILSEYSPDLILVPSLVEIHPDHLALSRAFCELLQEDENLTAALAVTRIAFYEVSNPLRPTDLVDITAVAEAKYEAIASHASQTAIRDYVAFARGLNAYRAMSLPREVQYAEAYRVVTPQDIRSAALSTLRTASVVPPDIAVTGEQPPVSVIVRTKNRPVLLAEAVASIRATGYPARIVVVNDGGAPPAVGDDITLISHETSRGRSEAMNAGVRAAGTELIAFLDDDDLYYAEHLAVLAQASRTGSHVGWYTDAVSVHLRTGTSGAYEPHERLRTFAQDYDAGLLLLDNYIPLPTLMLRRQDYLDAGGFDPEFDLFEDWDFLIRLSRRGTLLRVPRVTVEVRHFAAGDSILLSAPAGSSLFRTAKLQVWKKHNALLTHDVMADAIERQKERMNAATSRAIEETGRRAQAEREITRFAREKESLLAQLANANAIANERYIRMEDLDRAVEWLHYDVLTERGHVAEVEAVVAARDQVIEQLRGAIAQLSGAIAAKDADIGLAYSEISRLQGLLDMIFGSKTWQVHKLLEKLRGR